MVLAGDHDVLHAGIFGDPHILIGIEFHRVKPPGQRGILILRNTRMSLDLLAELGYLLALPFTLGKGIYPPVNEHSELHVLPLL